MGKSLNSDELVGWEDYWKAEEQKILSGRVKEESTEFKSVVDEITDEDEIEVYLDKMKQEYEAMHYHEWLDSRLISA